MDIKAKKPTVYDVAKESGTSVTTVSRVLSGSTYPVSRVTRIKVLSAAEKLGFFLYRQTDSPLKDRFEIGMIVPNLVNPYFWQLAMGVEFEARKTGSKLFLCNSSRNVQFEMDYLQSFFNKGMIGVLLSSTIRTDYTDIIDMQKRGLHIIMLEPLAEDADFSKVLFNYLQGGAMAIEHLASKGHRKIAFISSPIVQKSREETYSGYKLGLLSSNIPFNENHAIIMDSDYDLEDGSYEYEVGIKCAKKFVELSSRPTAAFCLNDMIAFGFINGLKMFNLRVPEDISVIGLDNIQASKIATPSLTTIAQPSYEAGRLAYRMLVDSIVSGNSSKISLALEPELIVRDSVIAINGA